MTFFLCGGLWRVVEGYKGQPSTFLCSRNFVHVFHKQECIHCFTGSEYLEKKEAILLMEQI